MELIPATVESRQGQAVLLKHRQKLIPLILALQKSVQVGMRSGTPVAHSDFQGLKAEAG
jgi:hypothetical protein